MIGKGAKSLQKFSSYMALPALVSQKSYDKINDKILRATTFVANSCMKKAAEDKFLTGTSDIMTMLPLLERAAQLHGDTGALSVSKATVLNMASMTGSIANTGVIFRRDLIIPAYKMSKAALNMAMRVFATTVKDRGILVITMCPGWVKTDMGTDKAVLEPEESIGTMIRTLPKLNESHHGTFIDRTGNPYPY
ncbi:hypothetical protein AVEN_203688-1 [Araneus ventricosus]|uniref:C-factor n=1 Tax=Araneus ventricosus TaxID=182803 RepID=A0A4Y2EYN5_ARAVE|nr:hypothetical protein AVEN_203688-1 [Araneus ventricosus]